MRVDIFYRVHVKSHTIEHRLNLCLLLTWIDSLLSEKDSDLNVCFSVYFVLILLLTIKVCKCKGLGKRIYFYHVLKWRLTFKNSDIIMLNKSYLVYLKYNNSSGRTKFYSVNNSKYNWYWTNIHPVSLINTIFSKTLEADCLNSDPSSEFSGWPLASYSTRFAFFLHL